MTRLLELGRRRLPACVLLVAELLGFLLLLLGLVDGDGLVGVALEALELHALALFFCHDNHPSKSSYVRLMLMALGALVACRPD